MIDAKIYYAARIEGDGGATEIDDAHVVLESDYHKLEAERDRLREALEWYANPENYFQRSVLMLALESDYDLAPVYRDFGKRAQSAIGETIDDWAGHKESVAEARSAIAKARGEDDE